MLSSDVLHLVISYLTKDQYPPLLKFRTVCRDWKEVAERSLVWGECKLTIRAPLRYRATLLAWDDQTFFDIEVFELHQPITELQNTLAEVTITLDENCSRYKPSQSQALDISKHFIDKFRLCHRSWNRFLLVSKTLVLIGDICNKWVESWLHEGLLWLSLATISILKVTRSIPNILQFEEKLGIFSIILPCFFLFDWTLKFMFSLRTFLRYSYYNILNPVVIILMSMSKYEKYTIALYIVGIASSYVLWWYLSLNTYSKGFEFLSFSIPLSVFGIIMVIMENKYKHESPVYFTFRITLYLIIEVVELVKYYQSFKYVCILFYPITIMMFIFSLLAIWSSVLE